MDIISYPDIRQKYRIPYTCQHDCGPTFLVLPCDFISEVYVKLQKQHLNPLSVISEDFYHAFLC